MMLPRLGCQFFNFGRSNRLFLVTVCAADDYRTLGYWISGRLLGCYISLRLYRHVAPASLAQTRNARTAVIKRLAMLSKLSKGGVR